MQIANVQIYEIHLTSPYSMLVDRLKLYLDSIFKCCCSCVVIVFVIIVCSLHCGVKRGR